MKAIRIHGFGGPDLLELDDVPIPLGEDELLVHIRAASVNPVDYKIRRGTVPWVSREMLPLPLGRDLSGTVESAGAGVDSPGEGVWSRKIGATALGCGMLSNGCSSGCERKRSSSR